METAGDKDNSNESEGIGLFLTYVSNMLERADFLIPLVAGQRQFREDNYQMASAAQLEDLFHDALGMFLRENHPRVHLNRRSGNELWDYGVGGVRLSHKESQSTDFAVWWTGGDLVDGKYVPRRATWDYDHPIVFVYTAQQGSLAWRVAEVASDDALLEGLTGTFSGSLGLRRIRGSGMPRGAHALVLTTPTTERTMRVEKVWPAGTWEELDFHDMWPDLGGPGIAFRDLWLDRQPQNGRTGLGARAMQAEGLEIEFVDDPLLPGIYVFTFEELRGIPLVANNRAHSASPEFVQGLMRKARSEDRYVPLPLWFAHFADAAPPNLYGQQRAQFEALFAPRIR